MYRKSGHTFEQKRKQEQIPQRHEGTLKLVDQHLALLLLLFTKAGLLDVRFITVWFTTDNVVLTLFNRL